MSHRRLTGESGNIFAQAKNTLGFRVRARVLAFAVGGGRRRPDWRGGSRRRQLLAVHRGRRRHLELRGSCGRLVASTSGSDVARGRTLARKALREPLEEGLLPREGLGIQ